MKNIIIYILLICIVSTILVFQTLKIRSLSGSIDGGKKIINEQKNNIDILKNMIISEWHIEGTTFSESYIFDEAGNKINIDRIIAKQPVVVFRFSKVDCSKCVVEQIDLIEEFLKTKKIEYKMICDYSNNRNLGLFKRMNQIKDQVYDSKKLFDNETTTPYFFVYDKNKVTDVFFPSSNFPDLTIKYFEELSSKYFN